MIYLFHNKLAIIAVIRLFLSQKYLSIARIDFIIGSFLLLVSTINVILEKDVEAFIVAAYLFFFLLVSHKLKRMNNEINSTIFLCFIPIAFEAHKLLPFYFEKSEFALLLNILLLTTVRYQNSLIFNVIFLLMNVSLLFYLSSSMPLLVIIVYTLVTIIRRETTFLMIVTSMSVILIYSKFELIRLLGVIGVFSEDLYRIYSNLVPIQCLEFWALLGIWSDYKLCGADFLYNVGISAEVIQKNFVMQSGSPQGFLFRCFYDVGVVGVVSALVLLYRLPSLARNASISFSQQTLFISIWYIFLFVQHTIVFFPIFLLFFMPRGNIR